MGRMLKALVALAAVVFVAAGIWIGLAPTPEPEAVEPVPVPQAAPRTLTAIHAVEVPGVPRRLVASPDGRTVAFEAFRLDGIRVRQVAIEGMKLLEDAATSEHRVTMEPSFANDNAMLHVRSDGSRSTLWRGDHEIDGITGKRLSGLSQSADGSRLAVSVDGTLAIWDGQTLVSHESEGRVVLTALHPRGDQVVTAQKLDALRLFVEDLATRESKPLTPKTEGNQTMPAWTADGVVFFEGSARDWTVKHRTETGIAILGEGATLPKTAASGVSPDGAWFAFFTGDQLVLARTDGSQTHTITPSGDAGSDPCFVVTPDGWMLAYTAGPASERRIHFAPLGKVLGPGGWRD